MTFYCSDNNLIENHLVCTKSCVINKLQDNYAKAIFPANMLHCIIYVIYAAFNIFCYIFLQTNELLNKYSTLRSQKFSLGFYFRET